MKNDNEDIDPVTEAKFEKLESLRSELDTVLKDTSVDFGPDGEEVTPEAEENRNTVHKLVNDIDETLKEIVPESNNNKQIPESELHLNIDNVPEMTKKFENEDFIQNRNKNKLETMAMFNETIGTFDELENEHEYLYKSGLPNNKTHAVESVYDCYEIDELEDFAEEEDRELILKAINHRIKILKNME